MLGEGGLRIVGVLAYNLVGLIDNEQPNARKEDGADIPHQGIGLLDGGDKHGRTIGVEPEVGYAPIRAAI